MIYWLVYFNFNRLFFGLSTRKIIWMRIKIFFLWIINKFMEIYLCFIYIFLLYTLLYILFPIVSSFSNHRKLSKINDTRSRTIHWTNLINKNIKGIKWRTKIRKLITYPISHDWKKIKRKTSKLIHLVQVKTQNLTWTVASIMQKLSRQNKRLTINKKTIRNEILLNENEWIIKRLISQTEIHLNLV